MTIWKALGLAALLAVPVALLLKLNKDWEEESYRGGEIDVDADLFEEELA